MKTDKLDDVVVNRAALFHGTDDAGEIIVGQHQRRRLLAHLGTGDAHGNADVGSLEGRRVIDAVTRHRHHMTACLQGFHDTHFVFGGNAGENGGALDQFA